MRRQLLTKSATSSRLGETGTSPSLSAEEFAARSESLHPWSKNVTFTRPWNDNRKEIMFARITGAGTPLGPSISHRFATESGVAGGWLVGTAAGKQGADAAVTAALRDFIARGP